MRDCIVTLIEIFFGCKCHLIGACRCDSRGHLLCILCKVNKCKEREHLISYPSNHSNEINRVVLLETIETGSSDPDIVTEMEDTKETKRYYERVLSMYNTLISVKRNCDSKRFKVERLLGFHDRGCQNITDYNLQPTLLSFNLLLDPTVKDGDCLFNSVLKQLNKLLFTNSNDEFSSHIAALDLLHEDKAIDMLKL